jgi:hypothetical protein
MLFFFAELALRLKIDFFTSSGPLNSPLTLSDLRIVRQSVKST